MNAVFRAFNSWHLGDDKAVVLKEVKVTLLLVLVIMGDTLLLAL
jgi:hypothetical protein